MSHFRDYLKYSGMNSSDSVGLEMNLDGSVTVHVYLDGYPNRYAQNQDRMAYGASFPMPDEIIKNFSQTAFIGWLDNVLGDHRGINISNPCDTSIVRDFLHQELPSSSEQ